MEFWFDDGYEADYSKTLPFLNKLKCTGITALVTGLVCQPGYMCERKLRALIGCGWKIASHGTAHESMLDMDKAATELFLTESRDWIKVNLGVEPHGFVAPWNVLHPWQRELALKYYKFVRDPATLHFHSNKFEDVERVVTKIVQGGKDAYRDISKQRYIRSQQVIKSRFGVDV